MARLLRERGGLGDSRRESSGNSLRLSVSPPAAAAMSSSSSESFPSPFGEIGGSLSDLDLRETAYAIFVAVCRTTGGKPLIYIPQSAAAVSTTSSSSAERSPSPVPSMQRLMTSAAAGKMKKALGLKPSKKSPGKESSASRAVKRPATVGELVRVQMRVSERMDSLIRRGMLRISASQLGRRIESIVLPLELLQQFKASDFPDQQEYEAWRSRNMKVLEAGLLLHPLLPLEKSDVASQRLRKIIRGTSENPIETGKNSESMQVLRATVMSLACRTAPGLSSDLCHWADGSPFNLVMYQMLLEVLFDYGEGSIVEEFDEILELIKKTWVVLGVNQMIHNLLFLWFLFRCFVAAGQTDNDLLFAADNQLTEVAKDAKTTKDPLYSKILSSTLSSIMGWTEKRLLAYHDTFNSSNIELMEYLVSLGVSAAKILVEDISQEYRLRRREDVDVARSRVDTYIRSSLRTAFAQVMEKADSKRSSRGQKAHVPILSILAKDISDLAKQEQEFFSPILKRWHPLAAGVAVATLHSCYGNELKQFISGVTDLTFDSIQVLKAAHKLEKELVHIAVEDSVDSEDGGKGLIREMPPYEAESAISSLTKAWVKARVDSLGELVERNVQQEAWSPRANKESFAPSSVEVLRLVDETLDAFFQLSIPLHRASLPDLIVGLDRILQYYVAKAKAGCGTRNTFIPALPALTRVEIASKLWKKNDRSQNIQRRKSHESTWNGGSSFTLAQFCVRMNTLHHIQTELENLETKITTCLNNVESSQTGITQNSFPNKFELTLAACQDGIQILCETTAYKLIFHDLSHVLWNFLYVGEVSSSRIDLLLKELDPKLVMLSKTVHNSVRNHAITALMKASFDGFLLVLLAGGPSRAFSRQDCQILEDDFKALKDLYFADGDGLSVELVEKAATQVKSVFPLFRAETESLILRFKQIVIETYGSAAKSRYPLPETSGRWSPTDANTILRVLCYRNDEAASKFLKKTYNLPKKL